MTPAPGVARHVLDGIGDALRSGVAPSARTTQRTLAALRELRATDGDAAARTAASKLRAAALCAAAARLKAKSARSANLTLREPRGVGKPLTRGIVAHPMTGRTATVVRREPGSVWIRFD